MLSPHRWQRFQTAKQQIESAENWGKRFTQEDLSERTGLSLNTLARILKRELGGDRLYESMNIQGATGLTHAQALTLKALGAISQ